MRWTVLVWALGGCVWISKDDEAAQRAKIEGEDAVDADSDGYTVAGGDCDDHNAAISPGADEVCNGVDDDCDNAIDLADDDLDVRAEVCNGEDDDCDGDVDEEDSDLTDGVMRYVDEDEDGYGGSATVVTCTPDQPGLSEQTGDCDDSSANTHPNAVETCHHGGDDCDDETTTCLLDERDLASWLVGENGGDHAGAAIAAGRVRAGADNQLAVGASGTDGKGSVFVLDGLPTTAQLVAGTDIAEVRSTTGGAFGSRIVVAPDATGGAGDELVVAAPGEDTGVIYIIDTVPPDSVSYADDEALDTLSFLAIENGGTGLFATSGIAFPDESTTAEPLVAIGAPGGSGVLSRVSLYGGEWWSDLGRTDGYSVLSATNDIEGGHSVVIADLNGDGTEDLAMGAPGANADTGSVFLHLAPYPAIPGQMETSAERVLQGTPGSRFGEDIAVADIDDDGHLDLLVTAPLQDAGSIVDTGALYLFLGPFSPGSTMTPADADHVLQVAEADFGMAVVAAGDLNGDDYPDIVVGAPTYDDDRGLMLFLTSAGEPLVDTATPRLLTGSAVDAVFAGAAGSRLGSVIEVVPSVVGDPTMDLAFGAPYWDADAGEEGAVGVLPGGAVFDL